MDGLILLARPWWVNIAILVPLGAFFAFRKKKLALGRRTLVLAFLFAAAFGFVEAAVVIYLRFAFGPLGTASIQRISATVGATTIFTIEVMRETATIVMLLTVAALSAPRTRERAGLFLWMFAAWDAFYYVFLALIIHWPSSLLSTDILFLIPTPWYAQVWFPLLVDLLVLTVVLVQRDKAAPIRRH